jgi:Capsule assembly protein Wzi
VRAGLAGLGLAIVAAALAAPRPASAQFGLVAVPMTDPAYDQLATLERMGCAAAHVSSFRPYDVRQVRGALIRAQRQSECQGPILDDLVKRFRMTPRDADAGLRGGASATVQATHLTRGEFLPLWNNVGPTSEGTPSLVATVHGRLSYGDGIDDHVAVVSDGYFESNARNDPSDRARNFRSTKSVFDFSEAYVNARAGPVTFSLGREQEAWLGEGAESLILSANGPAYDRLAVSFQTEHFEGRTVFGALDDVTLTAQQDSFNGTIQPQRYYRYIAAHAFTWRPSRAIEATIGETALLSRGSDVIDLYFVNPFVPYIVTQNDTGRTGEDARDNLTSFADVRARAGPVTFDGTLLVDDIQIDAKSRATTPDQLGWQLSASSPINVKLPWTLNALTVNALYERVDSYTYMREYYDEVYQHYNVPLGSVLGPDADFFRAGAEVYLGGWLRISAGGGPWRHGDNRIFDRPGREATGHADASFPTSGPGSPVQTAMLADLSVQCLKVWLPITLRVDAADIKNVNNTPSPAALYTQTQLIATYAFRYP